MPKPSTTNNIIWEQRSSKIKDLYFEIPNFIYQHGSIKVRKGSYDLKFIGRESVIEKIKTLVEGPGTNTGAYLVTGFRGMGKTSIVNEALNRLKKRTKKYDTQYHIIELSLAQDELTDREILKQIASKVYDELKKDRRPLLVQWATRSLFNIIFTVIAWFLYFHLFPGVIFNLFRELTDLPKGHEHSWSTFIFDLIKAANTPFWHSMPHINFALITYILAFLMLSSTALTLIRRFFNKRISPITRLKRLLDRINSRVTTEQKPIQLNSIWDNFNPFNRNSKEYPIANAKDIETELIQVFRELSSKEQGLFSRSNETIKCLRYYLTSHSERKFVFVFDEMDKIDAHTNKSIIEKESENPYETQFGSESLIRRQENIYKLLGNLKHFLNTADAKFIFIAGREMFDASLADVSDRDSFLGSIFHDVIYVKSFLKDKLIPDTLGITSMMEAYLCKMLLPGYDLNLPLHRQKSKFWETVVFSYLKNNHNHTDYQKLADTKDEAHSLDERKILIYKRMNLKTYAKYIDYMLDPEMHVTVRGKFIYKKRRDIAKQFEGYSSRERSRIKEKAIMSLTRFIIYTTYRSNGTPKKLGRLFEDYIVSQVQNPDSYVFTDPDIAAKKTYYLRFKYNDQYKFGFIQSLFRPYLLANGRQLKALGDKQLVSTSFLMDYIFKFHSIGFTYRNFELTPELIAFNKSPDLRIFIEQLIQFLNNRHVREVQNGLYQFKFNKRTSQEIKYLSKISEVESAAFNFTLDESLMVKRHYNKKIRELNKHFSNQNIDLSSHEFIHSSGFVNEVLGDLHYYDQEFDDAIIYYSNTIQQLRQTEELWQKERSTPIKLLPLILLLRVRLKLCLTLEKMKSFSTAYAGLLELSERVNWYAHKIIQNEDPSSFQPPISEITETTRLMIQPYVSKLFLQVKANYSSLTLKDIASVSRSIELVTGKETSNNKTSVFSSHILLANYYKDIGTLLFYKNGVPFDDLIKNPNYQPDHTTYRSELKSINNAITSIHRSTSHQVPELLLPISALIYYRRSLKNLMDIPDINPSSQLYNIRERGLNYCIRFLVLRISSPNSQVLNKTKQPNADINNALGDILAKIGDSLLAFAGWDPVQCPSNSLDLLRKLYDNAILERNNDLKENDISTIFGDNLTSEYFSAESVILHYYTAGLYYRKAGNNVGYASQLKKIIYVLCDCFKINATAMQRVDENIKTVIISEFLRSISWTEEVTDRLQVLKYRNLFKLHDPTEINDGKNNGSANDWKTHEDTLSTVYNNLSTNPDIQEMLSTYYRLLIRSRCNTIEFTLNETLISPNSVVDSKFVRIQQLNLKCRLNYEKFTSASYYISLRDLYQEYETLHDTDEPSIVAEHQFWEAVPNRLLSLKNNKELKEELMFLISDSIYCMKECIKMIQVFGNSYTISYSYLAACHSKLGEWCKYYSLVLVLFQKSDSNLRIQNTLKQKVISLVGPNYISYIEPKHHYQLAIQNYYQAIHVHSEGTEYRAFINNMYYLEDDFNDSLDHFSAAMERFKINSGKIRREIRALKSICDTSALYKLNRYCRELNTTNLPNTITLD